MAIGAVSALRVPALVFALIVFFVVCVYAVTRLASGDPFLNVALWVVIYEFAFEGGYVAGHVLRYVFRPGGSAKRSELAAETEEVSYPADQRGSTKSKSV
mgnify:CR=1 FL=1